MLHRYDDGFEEDAPAECVLPPGASAGAGLGGDAHGAPPAPPMGGGGFGRAAVARGDGSDRGSNNGSNNGSERRQLGGGNGGRVQDSPLAPRRRSSVGVRDGEKVRKQFEQERKARLEVIKLRPEDKRWAEQHGLQGDRGLFQGMIVRFRAGLPTVPPPPPPPCESRIAVFVRARPLLDFEAKAGGYTVVTPGSPEVSAHHARAQDDDLHPSSPFSALRRPSPPFSALLRPSPPFSTLLRPSPPFSALLR